MTWIKTKSAFQNEYYELINLETGMVIRRDNSKESSLHGIWLTKLGMKNDNLLRLYHSEKASDCEAVFHKICRKLGVHNEISPNKAF